MGFYEDKRQAIVIIDNMSNDGKSIDQIEYKIAARFGFGKRFVINRLKLLESLKDVSRAST